MNKTLVLLICFAILSLSSFSQNYQQYFGSQLIRNYTAEEYGSENQIWSIAQDDRGVMYFGNSSEMLTFDGTNWRTFSVANESVIRSIDIDSNGRINVGASDEFGYFEPDSLGELKYHSLSDKLPKSEKGFQDIWKTYATTHGTYFLSMAKIFRWYNGSITIIPVRLGASFGVNINDNIYVVDLDKGLSQVKDTSLIPLANCEKVNRGFGFMHVGSFSENELIISTAYTGMYIYNLKEEKLEEFPISEDVKNYMRINSAYAFTSIKNKGYAIGTFLGGVIIVNRQGELTHVVNENRGLLGNAVYFLFADRNNNLWVGLQNGISRVDLSYPMVKFTKKQNMTSYSLDAVNYEGKLYVATMEGCFYLEDYSLQTKDDNHIFKQMSKLNGTWDFVEKDNNLFAFGYFGIAQLKDTIAEIGLPYTGIMMCGGYTPKFPNHLFSGLKSGLMAVEYKEKKHSDFVEFDTLYTFENISEEIRKITHDTDGNLWISTQRKGVIFIRFTGDKVSDYEMFRFDHKYLPNSKNVRAEYLNNRIAILTQKGIFKPVFPEKGQPDSLVYFEHDTYYGKRFTQDSATIDGLTKISENLYIAQSDTTGFLHIDKNGTRFEIADFRRVGAMSNVLPQDNGLIYFTSAEAISVFDTNSKKDFEKTYNTLIRKVTIGEDSVIFNGNFNTKENGRTKTLLTQNNDFIPIISNEHNSITFDFSSVFFEESEDLEYSYMLDGYKNNWSKYNAETKTVFTNLKEGKYIFKVKAKNIYNTESQVAEFRFSVLPPWYRTIWAYISYLIFAGLFVYIIVKLNTQRLQKDKERLEGIVKERTKEIRLKNSELEQQKEEIMAQAENLRNANETLEEQKAKIEIQNEHIKGSIRYAQTIQQAILPVQSEIDKHLENFIIFRPKDIVSGDFYWFTSIQNRNEKIMFISVIDCTGHGVPGAFMSMIGSSLLNEIVKENKVYEPAKILHLLNIKVKQALKQDITDNDDGMELCLCRINQNNNSTSIVFSGAKRPMFYYNSKEKQMVKVVGDRKSVGGKYYQSGEFTNHEIEVNKGDAIYLSSDGLADQHSSDRKRFTRKKILTLLEENIDKTMENQKLAIEKELDEHKKDEKQRDDIAFIGFRIRCYN